MNMQMYIHIHILDSAHLYVHVQADVIAWVASQKQKLNTKQTISEAEVIDLRLQITAVTEQLYIGKVQLCLYIYKFRYHR